MRPLLLLLILSSSLFSAELILPSRFLERGGTLPVVYRTNSLATGKGTLALRWTDAHNRVVDERTIAVELNDENEIGFPLDLGRAAAMRNEVTVRFVFDGVNRKGEKDHREESAKAEF